MYACPAFSSQLTPLRNGTNTRYGRVANPYPTGTFTRQEAPSFARRDNVKAHGRRRRPVKRLVRQIVPPERMLKSADGGFLAENGPEEHKEFL